LNGLAAGKQQQPEAFEQPQSHSTYATRVANRIRRVPSVYRNRR
jgi:hypothetical protein